METSRMNGLAVLEGVIMRDGDRCAMAVRRPDRNIEVTAERFGGRKWKIFDLYFIRGIAAFIEDLYMGIKNFSAFGQFCEDNEDKKSERLQLLIAIAAISLFIGMFIALPYGLSVTLGQTVKSGFIRVALEAAIRLALLVLYLVLISAIPEMKRMYMYLGAALKTLNCLEKKIPLTVPNVRRMSRKYYRCGTVFVLNVFLISLLLFTFVRTENYFLLIMLRLAIIPAVAGISYEARELLIKDKNSFSVLLNLPLLFIHEVISDEPGEGMIEVAIKSASAYKEEEPAVADTEEKWYKNNKSLIAEPATKAKKIGKKR